MALYQGFNDIWQSFAVLLPVKSVGVMGDERTYANVVALAVVNSGWNDGGLGFSPYDILRRMSFKDYQ